MQNDEYLTMQSKNPISLFTLILMISFASVNAVLFTPALPDIASYFAVKPETAQLTITWYLLGYTFGQLLYGPISSRFGKKPALYTGIFLLIASSILCALAPSFYALVIGRCLMALGAGVGLKMTFTLVNEYYEPQVASQKIAYIMLSFAITPGIGVALGGILTTHFGWASCFYASVIYGMVLLFFVKRLPIFNEKINTNALEFSHLMHAYAEQFKTRKLLTGGFIMGLGTTFVYAFAASAPFIAIDLFGMSAVNYGFANLLPPMGLILGSLVSVQLSKRYDLGKVVRLGILIATIGAFMMLTTLLLHFPILIWLFISTVVVYFGNCFIAANASSLAMSNTQDKAHGSAVMSFTNMGTATAIVLLMGFMPQTVFVLPGVYLVVSFLLIWLSFLLK
jgi:DHA1 family bicyclomycin/chloramphenicol resistance-like MFS transporter